MLSKEQLETWQEVSEHLTKMENDPEYCKEIEKRLYKGVAKEVVEEIRQEGIANGSIKVSKQNKENWF